MQVSSDLKREISEEIEYQNIQLKTISTIGILKQMCISFNPVIPMSEMQSNTSSKTHHKGIILM